MARDEANQMIQQHITVFTPNAHTNNKYHHTYTSTNKEENEYTTITNTSNNDNSSNYSQYANVPVYPEWKSDYNANIVNKDIMYDKINDTSSDHSITTYNFESNYHSHHHHNKTTTTNDNIDNNCAFSYTIDDDFIDNTNTDSYAITNKDYKSMQNDDNPPHNNSIMNNTTPLTLPLSATKVPLKRFCVPAKIDTTNIKVVQTKPKPTTTTSPNTNSRTLKRKAESELSFEGKTYYYY